MKNKKKIIIDTDIGGDADDALAILLALNSPEIEVKAIITNDQYSKERAQIVKKLVDTVSVNSSIKIIEGTDKGRGKLVERKFVDKKFTPERMKDNLDFFNSLKGEEIYYVSIGNLSNISRLLEIVPDVVKDFKFIIMGGSVEKDYEGKNFSVAEWNIKNNLSASKKVFESSLEIFLFPLDVTYDLNLFESMLNKMKTSRKKGAKEIYAMVRNLQDFLRLNYGIEKDIVLNDPLTIIYLINEKVCDFEKMNLSVERGGVLKRKEEGEEMQVAVKVNKFIFYNLIKRLFGEENGF